MQRAADLKVVTTGAALQISHGSRTVHFCQVTLTVLPTSTKSMHATPPGAHTEAPTHLIVIVLLNVPLAVVVIRAFPVHQVALGATGESARSSAERPINSPTMTDPSWGSAL